MIHSPSALKIIAANVNGLGDKSKRLGFLSYAESLLPDILCLSDTRFDPESELIIKNESNFNIYFNSFSSNSRGVCVMAKKSLDAIFNVLFKDENGNCIMIKVQFGGKSILLVCLYGPNNDTPSFFENIFDKILNFNIDHTVICGDFNVTLDFTLDNLNYQQPRNTRARESLNNLILSNGFDDIFRVSYPTKRDYTWLNKSGPQKARLDYFLSSSALRPFITNLKSHHPFKSDHRIIELSIDFSKFKAGKGVWRHNDSFLSNIEYVNRINHVISTTLCKYVERDGFTNFFQEANDAELFNFHALSPEQKNNFSYKIDPNLLLEMIINDVRNESISYSSTLKRNLNLQENELRIQLDWLSHLQLSDTPPADIQNRVKQAQTDYENFLENKANVLYLDRLAKYKAEGEKPTAFFCSLENNRKSQKYISTLKLSNSNIETSNQSEIEHEILKFYQNLYSNKDNLLTCPSINDFLDSDIPQFQTLSDNDRTQLDNNLTLNEITEALRGSKNGGAPGFTGLTYAFYKTFWNNLKFIVFNSFNFSYQTHALPPSLSRGIISLLPKGNKPRNLIENYRPITLLDSLYKILSKVFANRINKVLDKIIHKDQNGFVKDRYIGECVRTTIDTMQWAKNNKKMGLLLLVDFRKAFDSISFKHINNCLKFFNFGDKITGWINLLLKNFSGCINHAGNISKFFSIERGCRQGDPIASLLFVIAVEILCIKLRSCRGIKAFKIEHLEILLSLYADDCTIFMQYDSTSLYNAISILDNFFALSGLEIHRGKSQVVKFGYQPWLYNNLCQDLGLLWEQSFKLLGVHFDANSLDFSRNIQDKIVEMNECANNWSFRFMTPIGRACIAKTLLLSKINHLAFILPTISTVVIKKIENVIYNFIWKGVDKVHRPDAKLNWEKGGLNLPDIKTSWSAFKLSWIKRFWSKSSVWGDILIESVKKSMPDFNKEDFWKYVCTKELANAFKKINSPFWSECLKVVQPFMLDYLKSSPEGFLDCYIWGNNLILKRNRSFTRTEFPHIARHIHTSRDVMKSDLNGNLQLFSLTEIRAIFPTIPQNEYLSFRQAILENVRKFNLNLQNVSLQLPALPCFIKLLCIQKKGCNKWTKIRKFKIGTPLTIIKREEKWEIDINRNLGPFFWDKHYKMTKNIFFDNRIKWLYYQILRHSLKTNYIVSKFKNNVSENCTFCSLEPETIKHLFWDCQHVKNFINSVIELCTAHPVYAIRNDLIGFLFGRCTDSELSANFIFSAYLKYYIWICRCKNYNCSTIGFKNWYSAELKILKTAFNNNTLICQLPDLI